MYQAFVKVPHPDHGMAGASLRRIGPTVDSREAAERAAWDYAETTWPLDAGRRHIFMSAVTIREARSACS
jgi:hypothetical protein